MTKMNPTLIIIIIAVAIIGGFYLLTRKTSNTSSSANNTSKKAYLTIEEAAKVVKQLEDLGYYKYADTNDVDTLRKDLISSLSGYSVLSTVYNEKTFIPLDNRLFMFDGETLFEQDGFMDVINGMRPLFNRMSFKVDITDHVEEGDNKWVNHRVTINGKRYIIFANFEGYGWGEAAQRFAEIINDQLELQNKDERLYLINGGNDGTSIYLTDEQFNLIDSILKDERWKPLKVERWCKVFEVDPTKYKGK
jgi:hypothetical protein